MGTFGGMHNSSQFLADLGFADTALADLPEAERAALAEHVREELETRVGTRLSEGLSDTQLEEFESIIDRNPVAITRWLDDAVPDFLEDPLLERISSGLGGAEPAVVLGEYAATKWLQLNRPDYRDVVREITEALKSEIRARLGDVLGA